MTIMKRFLPLFILLSLIAVSCNSGKEVKNDQTDSKAQQKMEAMGYVSGIVMLQAEGSGCPVVIKIENEVLDPIDLDEEFKVDQIAVWVKFKRLRRMNRCPKALPVSITDIKKKAG